MSRFTLLLIGSALMLLVAACDSNGDDDTADDTTDDTTELPADDGTNGTDDATDDAVNGEDDVTVPEDEDDAAAPDDGVDDATDDAVNGEEDDAVAPEGEDDPDATEGEDDAMTDDEMAPDDEDAVVDPEDMEPEEDLNQGMFFDLSIEEANELALFEVREPEHVPESLESGTIMGMASMEATPEEMEEEEEAATITFTYQQPPDDEMMQGLPVEFMQSTEIDMSEGLGEDAEVEEMTIGDREVTRIQIMAETGDEVVAYVWDEDEIHFSIAAILGEDLDESDLEAMIESVPA